MGFYKDASKITQEFLSNSDLDIMQIYERRASEEWLAGSWFSARKEFLKALDYGRSRLGKSHRFDVIYVETLRAYMQLCRDVGRIPLIGRQLLKKYISYPVDLIVNNRELQKVLLKTPYDRAHIARLFSWEGDELKSFMQRLPDFLKDESVIFDIFGETDNILGIINATRGKMLVDLSKGLRVKEFEVVKLLELSVAIEDNPGIVKACHILVSLGRIDNRTVTMFFRSLCKTQWIKMRKFHELMKFLRNICIGMAQG